MTKRPQAQQRDQRCLIDVYDAARRLGCSVWTVRRLIYDGDLTGYKIGYRMMRVDETELNALIDRSVVPTVGTIA